MNIVIQTNILDWLLYIIFIRYWINIFIITIFILLNYYFIVLWYLYIKFFILNFIQFNRTFAILLWRNLSYICNFICLFSCQLQHWFTFVILYLSFWFFLFFLCFYFDCWIELLNTLIIFFIFVSWVSDRLLMFIY